MDLEDIIYPSSHGLIQQNVGRFDISVDYRRNSLEKSNRNMAFEVVFFKRCIKMVDSFRN